MNIKDELTSLGYKEYISDWYHKFQCTDTLYQKKVKDDKGIRYFIDIWYYPEVMEHISIQIECQLYNQENTAAMDITLFEQDPKKAEEYLQYMWETLKLGYYEIKEEI